MWKDTGQLGAAEDLRSRRPAGRALLLALAAALGVYFVTLPNPLSVVALVTVILAMLFGGVGAFLGSLAVRPLLRRHGVPDALAEALYARAEEVMSLEYNAKLVRRSALLRQAALELRQGMPSRREGLHFFPPE